MYLYSLALMVVPMMIVLDLGLSLDGGSNDDSP